MLVSFAPPPPLPTHPLVLYMRNNFASQLLFFFIRVLLFWNIVVPQIQCSAKQFWADGGWEARCGWGMTYCRLLKWASGWGFVKHGK